MIIDLHTHILPAVDDGSADLSCSLDMLHMEARQGVSLVCASSHYYFEQNSIETFCSRREAAYQKILDCRDANIPRILLAAETAYFPGMTGSAELIKLCVSGTRTLLLEMPFFEWTSLQIDTIQTLVLDLDYQVVLVHPERFCFSRNNSDKLMRLCRLPIGLQVNAGALTRFRGRAKALELLEAAPVPLLGSDCHNTGSRPPNLAAGRKIVEKKCGADFLRRIDGESERLLTPARL